MLEELARQRAGQWPLIWATIAGQTRRDRLPDVNSWEFGGRDRNDNCVEEFEKPGGRNRE